MPIFKLETYPYVCRLCLKPEQHRKMTSLDTEDEAFEGNTFEQYLATMTFEVEEEKRHLFPRSICPQCKDLLRMFARFRTKVQNVHLFMNALVELRDFNTDPVREFFARKNGALRSMLLELNLCHKKTVQVEDLLDEFPQFKIAKLPIVCKGGFDAEVGMEESCEPEVVEEVDNVEEPVEEPVEDEFFGEELTVEQLNEEVKEIQQENEIVISEEIIEEEVRNPESPVCQEFRWECLDDSCEEVELLKKPVKKTRVRKAKDIPTVTEAKKLNMDFLYDSEPEGELTIEKVGDLDAALASRKYGTEKAKQPLQCPKCPYTTIFKSNYHSHQLTHLKREHKQYPCKVEGCTKICATGRLLKSHMEGRHTTSVCETCGTVCPSIARLKDHMMRYHSNGERTLNCQFCSKSFKMKIDLRNHVKNIHLADTVYKCETCGMEFRRKTILKDHEAIHSDVYNYTCNMCDKKFKIKSLLNKHIARVHRDATIQCDHCPKMFYTRWTMLDHVESVHEIQMRFICDICVASFESPQDLENHKARHTNPKLLECGVCLMVFSAEEQLSNHLCITYRDDYVCCGRDLRQHQIYNKHMFLQHGVKINARVKPDPNELLGKIRTKRKRVESCNKCGIIFPTRTLKKQHQDTCMAGEIKT